jgi:hypothetical protein
MSEYQIADGHDAEASFAAVTPQPASEGLLYPERVYAVDGTPIDKGLPFVIWRYGPELNETSYESLLTQFGLASAISNDVTIRTQTGAGRDTWTDWNGKIIKPERPEYRRGSYRNVSFRIIGLEST